MHPSLRSTSLTHDEEHEQGRNTPAYLLRPVLQVFDGVIDYDPCSNATSLVPARTRQFLDGEHVPSLCASNGLVPLGDPLRTRRDYAIVMGDGLHYRWRVYGSARRPTRVFCNPPWNDLARWLEHGMVGNADCEIVALLPLRSHRNYWHHAWTADAWCFLEPVTFGGFSDQFPGPCVMLYWGKNTSGFMTAFEGYGRCLTLGSRRPRIVDMTGKDERAQEARRQTHVREDLIRELARRLSLDDVIEAMMRVDKMQLGDIHDLGLPNDMQDTVVQLVESMPFKLKRAAGPKEAKPPAKKTAKKTAPAKPTAKPTAKKTAPKKRVAKKPPTNGAKAKVAAKPKANGKDPAPMTKKQMQIAELDQRLESEVLKGNTEAIKTKDVAEKLKVSESTALRALQRAVHADKAKMERVGRGAAYQSLVA